MSEQQKIKSIKKQLDNFDVSGAKDKYEGTDFWSPPNSNATNSSMFSALPGGYRSNGGTYDGMNDYGFWWTSTTQTIAADMFYLSNDSEEIFFASGNFKDGQSIRCMRPYSTVGITPIQLNKNLVKILDMMGRETSFKPNTPLIYVYDDGSTEKVFTIE